LEEADFFDCMKLLGIDDGILKLTATYLQLFLNVVFILSKFLKSERHQTSSNRGNKHGYFRLSNVQSLTSCFGVVKVRWRFWYF
jgi:hypothetical protein